MKNLIKWVSAILLLTTAVLTITGGGAIASVFFAMSGLLCLPPVFSLLQKQIVLSTWQKYLIIIVPVVIGIGLYPVQKKKN